jgi:hypothetical protein
MLNLRFYGGGGGARKRKRKLFAGKVVGLIARLYSCFVIHSLNDALWKECCKQ